MEHVSDEKLTCCFTGHRDSKLPWGEDEGDGRCLALKRALFDAAAAVYSDGVRHYICGMARGCDMYFCEAVIALRDERPDITLEAAIPWEGQARDWPPAQKKRYFRLVGECDYQTLVQADYSPDCMLRRNRYMVDASRILIAAYNGRPGGTMSTMLYAMRQGVRIIEIPID